MQILDGVPLMAGVLLLSLWLLKMYQKVVRHIFADYRYHRNMLLSVGYFFFFLVVFAASKLSSGSYGVPITTNIVNFEGKVFRPQAFVITEQHILLYDKDGKVYALDGITLDNLKPEQLSVGDNTYTVYRKVHRLFFGKCDLDNHTKSTI